MKLGRRIVNSKKIVFGKEYYQESQKRKVVPVKLIYNMDESNKRVKVITDEGQKVLLKDLIEIEEG